MQGITYKRVSRFWHRLDCVIEGEKRTYFGFSRREIFARAEADARSDEDVRRIIAADEQQTVIALSDARRQGMGGAV